MAAFRRIVIGSMGDELYSKLGSDPNGDQAWRLVRDLIGEQLFGNDYVTVPHLSASEYYNQLFVFVKTSDKLARVGLRRPTYQTVGNLDYLVNRELSTWFPQFDYSSWDVADGLNMYREYRFRVASQIGASPEKVVEILIREARARRAEKPTVGSLVIRRNLVQELKFAKTIYVISGVVLASFVRVSVSIGEMTRITTIDHDTPIGFQYQKFKVAPDGTFAKELHTRLNVGQRAASWLLPRPQPVPPMPFVFHHGHRVRKRRNNLTMHTPERSPRRPRHGNTVVHQVRRHNADGSLLRLGMGVQQLVENAPGPLVLNAGVRGGLAQLNVQNPRAREFRSVSFDNVHRYRDGIAVDVPNLIPANRVNSVSLPRL